MLIGAPAGMSLTPENSRPAGLVLGSTSVLGQSELQTGLSPRGKVTGHHPEGGHRTALTLKVRKMTLPGRSNFVRRHDEAKNGEWGQLSQSPLVTTVRLSKSSHTRLISNLWYPGETTAFRAATMATNRLPFFEAKLHRA